VWPPRSLDLMPLDFFLGIKLRRVSAPPMPQNPLELRIHIQNACESVDIQMLSNVFNEVDHLFLMHRITSGAYTDMR
jgi:hypothetical protein